MLLLMNRLLIILSLFIICLSIILLLTTLQKYELSRTKNFVLVTIQKLPDCNKGYKNKFLSIDYNGITYTFRTKCKYVQHLQEGQQLSMLHNSGTDIFIFKEQNIKHELIALTILALIGILCLILDFKFKKQKT